MCALECCLFSGTELLAFIKIKWTIKPVRDWSSTVWVSNETVFYLLGYYIQVLTRYCGKDRTKP